ncbi:CAAX protease self-immunity [Microbulbifer thermotolerans]|nr:CAAX protease self-immunity [Microbulbifer thermotolerans]
MSGTGIYPRDIFRLILLLELVALVVGLVGVFVSGVQVYWRRESVYGDTLTGLIFATLSFLLVLWLIRSNSHIGGVLRRHCADLRHFMAACSAVQIVVISLAAGICEEVLFRGFLQSWLSHLSSPAAGLLVASLVFALLHYASFIYFAATFLVGIAFGVCYRMTESLLCVAVWHAAYDLFVLTVMLRFPHLLRLAEAR